jgi:arginine deiminase
VTTLPDVVDGIHPFTLPPGTRRPVEVAAGKDSFVDVVTAR